MRKILFALALFAVTLNCFATRGYVGNNPVNEVMLVESSGVCGPASGACLVLYFDGGATGCSPSSDYPFGAS